MSKANSMWGKNGYRHDPKTRYLCEKCGVEHTYQSLINAHARENTGWHKGARVVPYKGAK